MVGLFLFLRDRIIFFKQGRTPRWAYLNIQKLFDACNGPEQNRHGKHSNKLLKLPDFRFLP